VRPRFGGSRAAKSKASVWCSNAVDREEEEEEVEEEEEEGAV